MSLWPAFMVLAILLHLADRKFGFGYLVSAIALIVFGVSAASAAGYSIADQEPYVMMIAPLILAGPIVRAVYLSRLGARAQSSGSIPATNSRDRKAHSALGGLVKGSGYLNDLAFHFVCFSMAAFVAYIFMSEQMPPPEFGTGLLVGGGVLSSHVAGKFTASILWRTLSLGLGLVLGGLLWAAAIYARLLRDGHVPWPI